MKKNVDKASSKILYENAVHAYCEDFYSQMFGDEQYNPQDWVGGDVGGVLELHNVDMFLNFDVIRKCVDIGTPFEVLYAWYEAYVERPEWCNLETYWKLVKSEGLQEAHEKFENLYPLTLSEQQSYERISAIKDMIKLADDIELKRTSVENEEEWYGFKEFRDIMKKKLEELDN